jgi:hypothetical protein
MPAEPEFSTFKEPNDRLQGINSASPCSLAGRYDNSISEKFPKCAMEMQAEYSFLDFSQIVQNY